jgi:hypothetical protein
MKQKALQTLQTLQTFIIQILCHESENSLLLSLQG